MPVSSLDIPVSEDIPEDSLDIALRKALADAETWQCLLKSSGEDSGTLLSPECLGFVPGELPSCEAIAMPTDGDETGAWAIGLAGHGIGNLHFCCKLRFPKLKAAICIPYGHPFDEPQEEFQDDRKSLCAACGMVAFLLRHAIAKQDFARNNPEACLTVVCDRNGTRFLISDADGTIAEGDSWLALLEKYFNPDFLNQSNLQIFLG